VTLTVKYVDRLGCSDRYISLWKERFQQERLSGLDSRYRGARHRRRTGEIEARILEVTRRGPTDGSTVDYGTAFSGLGVAKKTANSFFEGGRPGRNFSTRLLSISISGSRR
jgi:transposase